MNLKNFKLGKLDLECILKTQMNNDIDIQCPYCFETFQIQAYAEDGQNQVVVYDCEICCHPIRIELEYLEDSEEFNVTIAKENS